MKKLTILFSSLLSYTATISFAQAPALQGERSFGGGENDNAYSIQQTSDGGYIVAGFTGSFDGNVTGNHGDEDFWIVKLTRNRTIKWQKALGGFGDEKAFSIQQTTDGGYIVAGQASSSNGQVTRNHGMLDFWIVKLDSVGKIVWQKSLGGSRNDFANCIQQTQDGGYIAAGGSFSDDGNVALHHGPPIYPDYWIVKLNASGNIQWRKTYGGSKSDVATSIRQTADGGYIVAGKSASNDGDVRGVHDTIYGDFWILKLNARGNTMWRQVFGGSDYEQANSIIQTKDGGYIAAGWSRSPNSGDVTGNHGNYDVWVVKMNAAGTLQWQRSLGGNEGDLGYSIVQTRDNGYVIAGSTSSNNGNVSGNHGKEDFWLVKIDGNGHLVWQKTMGGSEYEEARSVVLTNDGGYAMAGFSGFANVNNGDVTGNHGGYDFWVTKLSADGFIRDKVSDNIQQLQHSTVVDLKVFPNPASSLLLINIGSPLASAELTIMNSTGQFVIKKSMAKNQQQVDISRFSPGMYFIIIQLGDNRIIRTFIKK